MLTVSILPLVRREGVGRHWTGLADRCSVGLGGTPEGVPAQACPLAFEGMHETAHEAAIHCGCVPYGTIGPLSPATFGT